MEVIVLKADKEDENERLDRFISGRVDDISRSYAAKLAESGLVFVCGKDSVSKNYKIKGTETIEISIPEPEPTEIVPEDIPLNIVYEDADLAVINKPQGMVVHPAPGNYTGTLVNALLFHCKDGLSEINGVIRPGIVHRIDKDTSGLLVIAKNNNAHMELSRQLKERKAVRRYWALVNGNIKQDGGTVNAPIARHPSDRKRMAVVQGGREAVTHFRVLERYGMYTLVECTLETGRTHQIRVHMASIGHSITGDKVYGIKKERFNLDGQLLHAKTIGFIHPSLKEYMEFDSDIPSYFAEVLNNISKNTF